jgi:hypothetical protein
MTEICNYITVKEGIDEKVATGQIIQVKMAIL